MRWCFLTVPCFCFLSAGLPVRSPVAGAVGGIQRAASGNTNPRVARRQSWQADRDGDRLNVRQRKRADLRFQRRPRRPGMLGVDHRNQAGGIDSGSERAGR